MSVLDDLPRGVPHRDEGPDGLPGAIWASPSAIIEDPSYAFDASKLFLGFLEGRLIGIKDDRHALLVAGSRAGKGRSVLIPTLLEYQGSALVIDPKAELASITARRRGHGGKSEGGTEIEGLGQKVIVLDPFEVGAPWLKEHAGSFNPMALLTPESETLVEDATLIADSFVMRGSDKDMHWDESALNFIQGVILHVATCPAYEESRNLITVRRLLAIALQTEEQDGDEKFVLAEQMTENDAADGIIQSAASDFYNKPENERGSVLSSAMRHTKFLETPHLEKVLIGTSLDLAELKTAENGLTVYLCLPASRMVTHGRWFRLIINLALEILGRTPGKPETGQQTLFLMDEFHCLGRMDVIATAAALMAGHPYHVKLWPILQDLSQLKALYKDAWETFIGNAGIIQMFANNDLGTLEFASKRLGKTSVYVEKGSDLSRKAAMGGSKSQSWSYEVHDLLSPSEVARYFRRSDPKRRQLVFYADAPAPLILERIHYDEFAPVFGGKFDSWMG